MNFTEIAQQRQSCRSYDPTRTVEEEKLSAILAAARLAPSACNGQPYHITVCKGEAAKRAARATQGMGMNKFATDAPVLLVIGKILRCNGSTWCQGKGKRLPFHRYRYPFGLYHGGSNSAGDFELHSWLA